MNNFPTANVTDDILRVPLLFEDIMIIMNKGIFNFYNVPQMYIYMPLVSVSFVEIDL